VKYDYLHQVLNVLTRIKFKVTTMKPFSKGNSIRRERCYLDYPALHRWRTNCRSVTANQSLTAFTSVSIISQRDVNAKIPQALTFWRESWARAREWKYTIPVSPSALIRIKRMVWMLLSETFLDLMHRAHNTVTDCTHTWCRDGKIKLSHLPPIKR
jgi:hypothetical protein